MKTLSPFPWRRLTPRSLLEHRLDERGELVVRDPAHAHTEPFSSANVRNGRGGFVSSPLRTLGMRWTRAAGDGWALRTRGEPITMARTRERWGTLVRAACEPLDLDERVLLTLIACESAGAATDAEGLVRAPRTEKGYPRRSGESDPGDFERDAEDWRTSRGAHSSHGLMQTLIATATTVRPDLFAGIEPRHYRRVLWVPANSIACGAAYLARFPNDVRTDPLATRFMYGAGRVQPAHNRWGAVLYDELVPLTWLAFWNDEAALRRATAAPKSHAELELMTAGPSPRSAKAALALLVSAGVLFFGAVLAKGAHR